MGLKWLRNLVVGRSVRNDDPCSSAQLVNLLPGVYYRLQLTPHLRLLDVGEGIFDLVGYKVSELLNESSMSYIRITHPELKEILQQKKSLCLQSREAKKLEYHLLTRSRSTKLIQDHFIGEYDSAGRLLAIHGYYKETEKSTVRLQLLNQLEAYRTAIDVSIISSVTDAQGTIIYANDNFKKVSQYADEELLGKNHRIVCSGHHPKSFFGCMWETLLAGKMWRGEILNRAKDGSLYWVDTVIIPVFDEHNTISTFLSLRLLITDRKRAEEQREKYISVLEDIAHVVAHDLRGPVSSILGLVSLVGKTGCSEQDTKRVMDYLVSASKKLDEITRDFSAKIYSADLEMRPKK